MVTAQQVYDIAIHLMDEQDETTGATATSDTTEYKLRTLSILNSLIAFLYPYSGDYAATGAGRPSPMWLLQFDHEDPDMEQSIPLDDSLSYGVLPYFLAAQLLSVENESLASWMRNQGTVALNELRNKVPAQFEPIESPYGGF